MGIKLFTSLRCEPKNSFSIGDNVTERTVLVFFYLQNPDIATLSTEVEACFPTQVLLIDVGSQTDQISHHHMVIPLSRQVESSLWKKEHHKKKKKKKHTICPGQNDESILLFSIIISCNISYLCFLFFLLCPFLPSPLDLQRSAASSQPSFWLRYTQGPFCPPQQADEST